MKKLLALAPLGLVVVACSSMSPSTTPYQNSNHTAPVDKKAYDRMVSDRFTCEDDGTVDAKYSMDTDEATITASLPKAQWNQQTLKMTIAPSGSGARYVNTTSSDTVDYEWHTKADSGILAITWANGDSYSVVCERVS